ncbi:MAG: hypothetical protein AB7F19_07695 [Candidatus Babeliales bacterium]
MTTNRVFFPQHPEHVNEVIRWLQSNMEEMQGWNCHNSYAVSINDGVRTKASILYTDVTSENCQMHITSVDPTWCNRRVLHDLFWYPFDFLKLNRITIITKKKNNKLSNFVKRIGFKNEGELEEFYKDDDALIWGILKRNCKWIKGVH